MQLIYELATVSYSPDLTDPQGSSLPIAVVVVGRSIDGGAKSIWIAAAAGIDAKQLGLDPLSTAMLADVPHMIRSHVDEEMKGISPDDQPTTVLRALHESLKTSIHVSELSKLVELTVDSREQAAKSVQDAAIYGLIDRIRAFPIESERAWSPRVRPSELIDPYPEYTYWQPLPGGEIHAA